MNKSIFRLLYITIILSTQIIDAQNITSKNQTTIDVKKLYEHWDSYSVCSDSSTLFVNNANYSSYFSMDFYSDSVLYWNIPFDPKNSHHGGSYDFEVSYYLKEDTMFISDEYIPIHDWIRASFKIDMQGDTALCLTRLRTLPSVYNYFEKEVFCGSIQELSVEEESAMQNGETTNLNWHVNNDSMLLFYGSDTIIVITNPDTCNYALISIYHPNETWKQSLNAIKTISGYENFNQFRITETPKVYHRENDYYILLSCKLSGLPDKLNTIYLNFYLGNQLLEE